jgi:ABC-type spermidine/putrescine transport system permease subunit II
MKFRRFIACEVAALVVLVPLVILGVALNITSPALRWVMNLFTISAAISAAVIPIVFYAFTPTLPELER